MDITITKNTTVKPVLGEKIITNKKTFLERYKEGESFVDLMRERVGSFEKRRQTLRNVVNIFVNKYYNLELRLNLLLKKHYLDKEQKIVRRKLEVLKLEIIKGLNELLKVKEMKDNNEAKYSLKSTSLFRCMSNLYNLRKKIEFLEHI